MADDHSTPDAEPSVAGQPPTGGPPPEGGEPVGAAAPADTMDESVDLTGAGTGAPDDAAPSADPGSGSGGDPTGGAAVEPPADVDSLLAFDDEMAALERERDEYLDALRRLQADFDNFRKRKQRETVEQGDKAVLDLVVQLLPVLDAGDMARAHGADDSVLQITGALYDTLAKAGLEGLDPAEGDPFDPTEHEAVMHEPADDGDAGSVISGVMRAGYRWRGRVVRAAMVKVKG